MKKQQEGSAMIVVMVVMIITVVLSLTLLLVSSITMSNATRANQKEQCRVTAVSVSNVLIEEIKGFEYDSTQLPSNPSPSGWERSLQAKLQAIPSNQWYSYDKNDSSIQQAMKKDKDYYTYELDGNDLPGTTVLGMYWVDESEEKLTELDLNEPEEAAELFQNVILYLNVTSTIGEESSTVLSIFRPEVVTKIQKDPVTKEETIIWEKWSWKYDGHDWERGDS